MEVPVDANGRFAMKQIKPAGAHSVEVHVADADGAVSTFRRNLSIAKDDWFYVAIGDLTIGEITVLPARHVWSPAIPSITKTRSMLMAVPRST